jgi:hypothetical protein
MVNGKNSGCRNERGTAIVEPKAKGIQIDGRELLMDVMSCEFVWFGCEMESYVDLDNPNYLYLKKQLIAVRSANAQCRFLYLMGRTIKGKVYFIADSEPADSKDYSLPGQVYEEVSEGYRRVFDTKTEAVEGPVSDRWGTWISALIPLIDPQNGSVVAVLGMDIDARTWKWDRAAQMALPVGLVVLLIIVLTATLFSR